ncbi:hypothetical protein [Prauserella endophytica]|uniref:hypothetical protein n=1 Tax=Prauserella endophytica TaxID=1592324 RepID=UPI0014771E40|nr:hypothetical protein [Prauserella endophytica]
MLTVLVVVVWWVRMGWRLVPRLGQRSLGVLNPPPQTPRLLLLNPLVSGGIGGRAWKAD